MRNHSDLLERKPSRVLNPAGALTFSLILSRTGSSTRNMLSSYKQGVSIVIKEIESQHTPFFFM